MSTHEAEELIPADTFEMRLAIARFHAGNLSAAEAGKRVGVSGQAWRNWEAGTSTGAKRPSMLAFIAEKLNIDEEWLRDGGPLNSGPDTSGDGIPDSVSDRAPLAQLAEQLTLNQRIQGELIPVEFSPVPRDSRPKAA